MRILMIVNERTSYRSFYTSVPGEFERAVSAFVFVDATPR